MQKANNTNSYIRKGVSEGPVGCCHSRRRAKGEFDKDAEGAEAS